jgi:RTX calcium-binding nonapeptide repeat (4 copies)
MRLRRLVVAGVLAVSMAPTAALAASGGPGNDTIYGTPGQDDLRGGPGNDVIYSGAGADSVFGGSGFDTCYVGRHDAVSGCEVTK